MELDYYDYNVINAGAAPGSYLGMDPAFLVWIPPLDDGSDEDKKDRHGARASVSDDDDELTELANRQARDERTGLDSRSASITPSEELIRQLAEQKRNDYVIVSNSISKSDICSESDGASTDGKVVPSERRRRKLHELILVRRNAGSGGPGGEPGSGSSVRKSSSDESTEEREKETSFTKSPVVDNKQISDFYEMADIAFADDEADEEEEDDDEQEDDHEEPPGGFCEDLPKGGTILVKESKERNKYQTVVAGVQRREGEKIAP